MGGQEEGPEPLATVPCREEACTFMVDWRGTVPPADRKYGALYDLGRCVLGQMQAMGYQLVPGSDASESDGVVIRLEPRLTPAICEAMHGTNSRRDCRAIGEVRAEVRNLPDEWGVRGSVRIKGQCGSRYLMHVTRMSEYVAEMIDYEFRASEDPKRPSSRC